jgi:hypothetical protein
VQPTLVGRAALGLQGRIGIAGGRVGHWALGSLYWT